MPSMRQIWLALTVGLLSMLVGALQLSLAGGRFKKKYEKKQAAEGQYYKDRYNATGAK